MILLQICIIYRKINYRRNISKKGTTPMSIFTEMVTQRNTARKEIKEARLYILSCKQVVSRHVGKNLKYSNRKVVSSSSDIYP